MRALKYLAVTILIVVLITAVAAYIGNRQVDRLVQSPLFLDRSESLVVKPGTSFKALVTQLQQQGLIQQPLLLRYYARQQQLAHRIKAGEYQLDVGLTHGQLLQLLVSGKVKTYQVTLVEGQTVAEFVERLQDHPQIEKTLETKDPMEVGRLLNIAGSAEGWIYPDTYQFTRGTRDIELLARGYQRMQQVLEQEWQQRQDELVVKSAYEALILASIVEKETGVGSERAQIAGVFSRRLQKGMRLQTDPTVIYGMGERYQGNITRSDLRQESPYNTYVIKGLPPTPIANPGRAAIHAALHPAPGSSLYFVARGDGSHQFSATLAEHNRAVYRYQRSQRRKDYRSAPPVN